jgi:hypothetical protein
MYVGKIGVIVLTVCDGILGGHELKLLIIRAIMGDWTAYILSSLSRRLAHGCVYDQPQLLRNTRILGNGLLKLTEQRFVRSRGIVFCLLIIVTAVSRT